MAEHIHTKVLIVGGGPGGYVAAIRCGQLGLDTTMVESDRLGGTCLIRGCIPSKAVIHVAGHFETMMQAAEADGRHGISLASPPKIDFAATVKWKDGVVDKLNGGVTALLKRAKVRVVAGWATFRDGKTCTVATKDGEVTVTGEKVILATGSLPVELPFLKFGGNVISSTEALSLPELPKKLVVIGAGYIGLELGIAFRKLGVAVEVVEATDRILPQYDAQLVAPVAKWLEKHGVVVHLRTKAEGLTEGGKALRVSGPDGTGADLPGDKFLVTVGRKPRTAGWGLETMSVDMAGPFVKVDDQCQTSMKDVWAIGDLVGEPMLEHKAATQGEIVAEIMAGKKRHFRPAAIPAVCFTEPEIVSVGALPGGGANEIVAQFPFSANGRALSMEAGGDGGFVRVVAAKDDHRVLGIQAVGAHIAELAGEFSHALEMGALLEDVAGTIHAHPTLGEAYHEAALRALGHAIHI
ncbi:MAG: dihydrolipoyl dehydrogenase [Alphaproteobacteria bacterium]|nr:dihydrolipoyl dehydrogenase [Alphaproteobacteria bacterium]MBL7097728.1 dihydrolipoyl dehydrogenase [Alphaproteobacteria bacterium]